MINKYDLIEEMADKANIPRKSAEAALMAFTNAVTEALMAGEKVQIVGFGTFETIVRSEREGRNPRTGEVMTIASSKAAKFKPGKVLKEKLNG